MPVLDSSSSFPQKSANMSVSKMAAQIARYIGGESDGDILGFAHVCIEEAVQTFNAVPWKFNRTQQSITLTTAETYSLNAAFRSPHRAYLLDSNSKRRSQPLGFVPFSSWNEVTGATNFTTAIPELYTVRNYHADGLLSVWPPPASTLTYPTVQLNYHSWITVPADDSGAIDVPRDVNQAILAEAKALLLSAKSSGRMVDRARAEADRQYLRVAQHHRDFTDIPVVGAGV